MDNLVAMVRTELSLGWGLQLAEKFLKVDNLFRGGLASIPPGTWPPGLF